MWVTRITVLYLGASYALALFLELAYLLRPRPLLRWLATVVGGAGVVAHTLFLAVALFVTPSETPLASQFVSLLLVAWIVAIFYFYGTLHHRRQAWGVFVLPVVLFLVVLATAFPPGESSGPEWLRGERLLPLVHGVLLLLAAVGACVGFVASVMYLFQAHRLKAKLPPGKGIRLLSLERLESMIRHAIVTCFPLLTLGLLTGVLLLVPRFAHVQVESWLDLRIVTTIVLWVVFGLLVYLRYGYRLRARRVALLTILAFALLVCTLAASHTVAQGGVP
ncbi:MAG TPA: cytochrome c biogenesis protein CcsA [Gemmataceae bacterium]|nr:cytochrome c biogenesis protein CcsA [Gemmataceae bacterium]